jgi:Predicted xylanase/chitin deacetylase
MFISFRFCAKRWFAGVLIAVSVIVSAALFAAAASVPPKDIKTAFLTFDDGPSYVTPRLLETLKKHNIKATFFVTGQYEEYFPVLKQISDDGHVIALHSYTHDFSEIYSSPEAFWEDMARLDDLIFEITGHYAAKILRFPGGSSNTVCQRYGGGSIMHTLIDQCEQKGYAYFDWTIDTRDALGGTVSASTICTRVTDNIEHVPVAVILMHDGPQQKTAPVAADTVIASLTGLGYVFDTLDHLAEKVHHTVP